MHKIIGLKFIYINVTKQKNDLVANSISTNDLKNITQFLFISKILNYKNYRGVYSNITEL
jgi:hypothetical protein